MPASGRARRAAVRASSQRGWGTASSLRVAMKGAAEAAMPWLTAAPKPRLDWFSITRAPGAAELRRTSAWPLLSMTMTSKSRMVWRLRASTHSRRLESAASVGITTDTRKSGKERLYRGGGGGCGGWGMGVWGLGVGDWGGHRGAPSASGAGGAWCLGTVRGRGGLGWGPGARGCGGGDRTRGAREDGD